MKNSTSSPSTQCQKDATNKHGQKHTMPGPSSPPAVNGLCITKNSSIDPKSTMGYRKHDK